MLRDIPDNDQKTLDEIGDGYVSDLDKVEIMAARRILEKLIETTGSSGYGFPFSLKHMNFYLACLEAKNRLAGLSGKIVSEKAKEYVKSIMDHVAAITDNDTISATGRNLGSVNALFQSMRRAFKAPRMGKMSDEIPDDDSIHDRCSLIVKHMERFFRKLRRNVRKRTGNMSTGTVLTKTGESLALFQNMENPEYVKIVFGSRDIASVFAKLRKPFMKKGMTTQRKKELMKKGTEMLMKDSLPNTPYTPKFMEQTYSSRRSSGMI